MNEEVVETYQRKFVISKDVLKEGKACLGSEPTPGSRAHAWERSARLGVFKLCLIVETKRIMPSGVALNVEERKEELSMGRNVVGSSASVCHPGC